MLRSELLAALGRSTATPDELEALVLADTSRKVASVVRSQLEYLGTAIGDAVNILNPQRVVLGGFLATLLQRTPTSCRRGSPPRPCTRPTRTSRSCRQNWAPIF